MRIIDRTGVLFLRYSLIGEMLLVFALSAGILRQISVIESIYPQTQFAENCENAMDDDSDGLVDLNDPDCACPVLDPVSLIPNPSFEEMNCCPGNRSQLDCAETWIQASEPTTDYIHTCGWMGWDQFPPPLPFPDGEGIMGFRDGRVITGSPERNWKEYAGACLLGPLKANTNYRFEFFVGFVDPLSSPSINITFFGTADCANLPFGVGNDAFGCPTNGPDWERLGSSLIGAGSGWVKTSINVKPKKDIVAIAIGPDCPGTSSSVSTYYFFDDLVLADQRAFDFQITEVGHPCSDQFLLTVPEEENLSYQWYREGIALVGENNAILSKIYGEGQYQVRIIGENECKVTKVFTYGIPVVSKEHKLTICDGDVYPFGNRLLDVAGNYIDTFKTAHNCDSIVSLQLKLQGLQADTVRARIFRGERYNIGQFQYDEAGEYAALLQSTIGCDSLVELFLDYYDVYIPNVFSPDGDGQNDHFSIHGNRDLIEIRNLTVFDRWGIEVYNVDDLFYHDSKGWDGRHHGQFLNSGVYTYLASIEMEDGIKRQFSGTVLLVR